MPLWDFKCHKCGRFERDVASAHCDPDPVTPVCCGQKMEICYGHKQPIAFFEPFVTTHFDGEPRTIRTKGELTSMEHEFGLVRVDDPNLIAVDDGKFARKSTRKLQYFDCGRGH